MCVRRWHLSFSFWLTSLFWISVPTSTLENPSSQQPRKNLMPSPRHQRREAPGPRQQWTWESYEVSSPPARLKYLRVSSLNIVNSPRPGPSRPQPPGAAGLSHNFANSKHPLKEDKFLAREELFQRLTQGDWLLPARLSVSLEKERVCQRVRDLGLSLSSAASQLGDLGQALSLSGLRFLHC